MAGRFEGLSDTERSLFEEIFLKKKKKGPGMPLSAFSAPANEDERKHVEELLEKVEVKTGKPGGPPKKVKRLAADKGYDSNALRNLLKANGIQPQIPRKRNAKKDRDGLYL